MLSLWPRPGRQLVRRVTTTHGTPGQGDSGYRRAGAGSPCGRDLCQRLSLWKRLLCKTVLVEDAPLSDCPCGRVFFSRLSLWKRLPLKTVLMRRLSLPVWKRLLVEALETLIPSQDCPLLHKTVTVIVDHCSCGDCACGRDRDCLLVEETPV